MNTISDKKHSRDSSFELLRIIAMIHIVAYHFATHGGFVFDSNTVSIPQLWLCFLKMGGNLGVDIFVIISGYFLVTDKSKEINIKKILRLWGEIIFYSISIYVICGFAGVSKFDIKSLIMNVLPITFSRWWFASTYFVLYLIHPFINLLVNELDKKTYQKMLILVLIMWCVIPSFTLQSNQSNEFVWFVTLYCVEGYIRLHGLNNSYTVKGYALAFFIFTIIQYCLGVALIIIGSNNSIFLGNNILDFNGMQSVLTFLRSISLFMCFANLKLGYLKLVNTIATATFGVYLIHDNNIIRPLLWEKKYTFFQDSIVLVPYSIIVTVLVFSGCIVIDLVRMQLLEKWYMRLV